MPYRFFTASAQPDQKAALRLLASALREDRPKVILDEMPYLIANDTGVEGPRRSCSTASCPAGRCCCCASDRTWRWR